MVQGVAFCVDVRNLLEFERAFQGHREIVAATQVEEIANLLDFLSDHLDLSV